MHDGQPGTPESDLPPTLAEDPWLSRPVEVPPNPPSTSQADHFATRAADGTPSRPATLQTEGYDLLEEIGRGGMGVVYRARDRRRGQVVALKTMQGLDPAALLRFKQEFRTLADVVHPNLVGLYEMISDGEVWYFTMEFVDGVDFLSYLRPEGRSKPVHWSLERADTLAGAFLQLAEGVQFLHDAGKLHRDLKPRNVLVAPEGRVFILDFGLAAELDRQGLHESVDRHLLGTLAYMSPEQAAAKPLSPASDWYSVGVMLFEALTGRLPFLATGFQVAVDKQQQVAPLPGDVAAGIPELWNELCAGLLERDPHRRLAGPELLRRLAPTRSVPAKPAPTSRSGILPLVGRQQPLQVLDEAYQATVKGRAAVCLISGTSGSGKSTLVQRFLDGLPEAGRPLIFSGQCYQQESVPYKAFDSLVDGLSRFLSHLSPADVHSFLPDDTTSLARVFPVLRNVAHRLPGGPLAAVPDPRELRRRAFSSLRELLTRLGRRRQLVLYIDDLQWGDFDSLTLLAELLRPPDPPRMLLIGTYRSEEMSSSPFLQGLLAGRDKMRAALVLREVNLEPLTAADARDLALMLLDGPEETKAALAEVVSREAGGNPFFVHELVQRLQGRDSSQPSSLDGTELTLDAVLWRRIQRLTDEGQKLLAVLATAGRPLGRAEAWQAAELHAPERSVLAVLRAQRLVRTVGATDQDLLATYHDRIRETVLAHLPDETRAHYHRRLADVLEATGHADPEVLAVHFQGAGNLPRAAQCSAQAADRAAEALAFDRAARLYRTALELSHLPNAAPERYRLRERLADALASAGRCHEAGRGYLELAEGTADADARLGLRRKACAQLLNSGHVAEGVRIARDVLAAVGLPWPATPGRALVALLARRAQLWCRGLRFRERAEREVSAADLRRVDTSWSVAPGLSGLDPVRGAYFQALNLLHALHAGEPYRVARALAVEACHRATAGTRATQRTARVLAAAEAIAGRLANPHVTGLVTLAQGVARYLSGDWLGGSAACGRAETFFRDQCLGVAWELNTAQAFRLYGMLFAGQIAELSRCCPVIMKEARDRGDLYAFAHLGTFIQPFVDIAAGRTDVARRDLETIMAEWPEEEFYIQHANSLLRHCEIDLYHDDAAAAAARVEKRWPAYSRSLILRVQHMRICAWHLRARVHLALAASSPDRRDLLKSVAQCVRKLEREPRPDARALGQAIRAGAEFVQGRAKPALEHLRQAADNFDRARLGLFAAATRYQLGRLLGGHEGAAITQAAHVALASEGVGEPARLAAVLVPGFGK